MPFHAAGGLVTAMVTSSTPATHAAFSASRPPMPPDGTYSSAPLFSAARSMRARSASSQSAPPDSTIVAMPRSSSVSAYSCTASCEAASTTTSGFSARSPSRPVTKGTSNSAASGLPRERSLRPAIATTSVSPRSPRCMCSRNNRAMVPPPIIPTRIVVAPFPSAHSTRRKTCGPARGSRCDTRSSSSPRAASRRKRC